MAKIDEIKEHIGALKGYLNIIIAVILALGAGTSRLYLSGEVGVLFYIGLGLILLLLVVFALISRAVHVNIKRLRDL